MSKEEILKGNNLIAEFMGNKVVYDGISYHFYYKDDNGIPRATQTSNLYNSSWDWLMPVVEKISDIKHWSLNGTIEWLSEHYDFDGFYKIEDLFKAVVVYLKDTDETN